MNRKALIIDDDPDILHILLLIFEGRGFSTVGFSNSIPIEEIARESPDVILLDEWLKGSSGSRICREVKTDTRLKDVPVYLVSAVINLNTIASNCLADGFIEKPFQIEQIEAIAQTIQPLKLPVY